MRKINNKKAWLRIVEAFIAVFIIISVALFVINKDFIAKREISEKIYAAEVQLLQEVIDEYNEEGIDVKIDPANDLVTRRKPKYLECYLEYLDEGNWITPITQKEKELLKERDIYVQTLPILAKAEKETDLTVRIVCWLQ